jgi:ABC-type Zn uptake system ZnuABC Zn-binding protein ZnuA
VAARNIATGLVRNDPRGEAVYRANLRKFETAIDERLFGADLVRILGGPTLCELARKGTLIPFLEEQEFQGKPLLDRLGGWMKEMLPLRGASVVTYHKNWVYFLTLFGIEEAGTVEPKPGIPPSTKHVAELVDLMRARGIRLIMAANYFDEEKVRAVASRVDGVPVIVPLYVGGAPGIDDYFALFDHWVKTLTEAAQEAGMIAS